MDCWSSSNKRFFFPCMERTCLQGWRAPCEYGAYQELLWFPRSPEGYPCLQSVIEEGCSEKQTAASPGVARLGLSPPSTSWDNFISVISLPLKWLEPSIRFDSTITDNLLGKSSLCWVPGLGGEGGVNLRWRKGSRGRTRSPPAWSSQEFTVGWTLVGHSHPIRQVGVNAKYRYKMCINRRDQWTLGMSKGFQEEMGF